MQIPGFRHAPALLALALGLAACSQGGGNQAQGDAAARGKYLVAIIGCNDCHTPGGLTPKPDMARFLGGSDISFSVPGLGDFTPPNLTPDKTGLADWTPDQIATAITTGKRPDGRMLAPTMPWNDFAALSHDDALAIAAYLKSLPPVVHKVPGPGPAKACGAGEAECIIPNPGG